jgi:hypothetical protein
MGLSSKLSEELSSYASFSFHRCSLGHMTAQGRVHNCRHMRNNQTRKKRHVQTRCPTFGAHLRNSVASPCAATVILTMDHASYGALTVLANKSPWFLKNPTKNRRKSRGTVVSLTVQQGVVRITTAPPKTHQKTSTCKTIIIRSINQFS